MKFLLVSVAIFFCITTSFVSIHENSSDDCQAIVDSALVFVQTTESVINIRPTIKDPERALTLNKWLEHLSFKELRCLLNNDNASLKIVGFTYAAFRYWDSLLKNYSYLLKDTSSVQLFAADGTTSKKMKLGELLSMLAASIKQDNENFARQPEVELAVSTFIKTYSTFPETYRPFLFPEFSMHSDNEGLSGFTITHDFELKNNSGELVRVVNVFEFDKYLRVDVIEKDSSSHRSSYPLRLTYWLREFGRQLNKQDSLNLRLR